MLLIEWQPLHSLFPCAFAICLLSFFLSVSVYEPLRLSICTELVDGCTQCPFEKGVVGSSHRSTTIMLPQNDSEPLGDFSVSIFEETIDVTSIPPLPPDADETTSLLPRKSRRDVKHMDLTIESHHQRTLSDDVEPSDFKMKSIKLLSWNTFSIPFANPRFLSNPLKCCQPLENMLNETGILINEENGDNELVLFCFQELWAFKVGIFPKFMFNFLKYMECIPILGYLLVMLRLLILCHKTETVYIVGLWMSCPQLSDHSDSSVCAVAVHQHHAVLQPQGHCGAIFRLSALCSVYVYSVDSADGQWTAHSLQSLALQIWIPPL